MRKVLRYEMLLFGLLLYLFVIQIITIWPFTIDDMYISLRYAKHWADSGSILWNLHEAPVEGYSNFSFLALATLAILLNTSPVMALKLAGLSGLIFTVMFVFLISRFYFERREALLPCIGLLLYQGQIIWAVSGLETSVFEALMSGSVYFSLRALGFSSFPQSNLISVLPRSTNKLVAGAPHPPCGHLLPKPEEKEKKRSLFRRLLTHNPSFFFLSGLFLSLAGLTRPEAPALMFLVLVLIFWDTRSSIWALFWFIFPITLIYMPYFFWRWHYYGLLFPNPVYCKGFVGEFSNQLDKNYLILIWPFLLFALPALHLQDKRHYFLWLPSLIYLILLFHADPIVAFSNRLFLPAFVLLFPLALKGLSELLIWYLKERDKVYFICLYISVICFAFLFIPSMSLGELKQFTLNPLAGERLRTHVVHWLARHTKEEDKLVLADCGMIPYFSNLNVIDSYCLNNKAMGQLPPDVRYERFCHQVLEQKPKVIILTSLITQENSHYTPSDFCLKKLLENQKKYKLVKIMQDSSFDSTYQYELYMKT